MTSRGCLLLSLVLFLPLQSSAAAPGDTLRAVFWNVENFFDWHDGGTGASDAEFSAGGARHWTARRFFTKCNAIAKTLLYLADEEGALPDLIGLAEVENRFVLRKLLDETLLRKADYGIIHYDSPDPRGIDVALLYRRSRLDTVRTVPVRVPGVQTRDMLLSLLRKKCGDSLAVVICHHPSKYGGAAAEPRREAAVRRLAALSDSLAQAGWARQVALGDFNDTPDAPLYRLLDKNYVNLTRPLAEKGDGSIRFEGRWELIDQCLVSPDLAPGAHFRVCHIPFLTTRDRSYAGQKPLRTYVGPRYQGGVSDHRPVFLRMVF
ncbi:MAG: endonuclease/exonuclease/phosphatase family protein [Bacteroidales bacterium]|nr:endonuclease/exonuclease/phosphatase family protein [Bacteroidales bacterium]